VVSRVRGALNSGHLSSPLREVTDSGVSGLQLAAGFSWGISPKLETEITPSIQESSMAGTMENSQASTNHQQHAPSITTTFPTSSTLKSSMSTTMKLATEPGAETLRRSYLNMDTFSPVNEHGSFEFDRVLKTGAVLKRTRKTKVDIIFFKYGSELD
jgi:hypothetical protein